MGKRCWTLKYFEEQGGRLSTDGKSFTFGGRTYPCRLQNFSGRAKIVFNDDLMNITDLKPKRTMYTPKQSEESALTPQLPTCLYVKAAILPSALMALLKDSAFTTIGDTRYLRLKCEIRQAGVVVDKIL